MINPVRQSTEGCNLLVLGLMWETGWAFEHERCGACREHTESGRVEPLRCFAVDFTWVVVMKSYGKMFMFESVGWNNSECDET